MAGVRNESRLQQQARKSVAGHREISVLLGCIILFGKAETRDPRQDLLRHCSLVLTIEIPTARDSGFHAVSERVNDSLESLSLDALFHTQIAANRSSYNIERNTH